MITIDRINNGKGYWYHFPTIDFKFQNRGRATAFLWQFSVEVIHAKIDQTPLLDFRSHVAAGMLNIQVVNNGWGDAHNCQVQLHEPTLDLLFSDSVRQCQYTLQSGKTQDIFQLNTSAANPQQLQVIKERFEDLPSDDYDFYFPRRPKRERQKRGLRLKDINLSWHCDDGQYKGDERVRFHGAIILTESGFDTIPPPPPPPAYMAESDTTYGAIIDPSQGSYEQKYPISRKIPSGDVERFHIMVGSSISCHLQVRFKFFIDQTSVVESEIFNISIWNPRNSYWHSNYTDDKSKLRRSFDYGEKKKFDPSVFPLTADKSPNHP